jgi:hypothetical protein
MFISLAGFELDIYISRHSSLFGLLLLGFWVCGILGLVTGMIGFTFLGVAFFSYEAAYWALLIYIGLI